MKLKSILILSFLFVLALNLPAKDSGYLILRGTFFLPGDSNFQDVYGSSAIMPGIGFGVKVMHNVFFFADVDYLAKTGIMVGELKDSAKTSQIFVIGGLEMRLKLTAKHEATFRAGAAYINFEEKAFSETGKGSSIGFLLGAGLNWKMKLFFLALDIDYLRATGTPFNEKIILGGMKAAVGIGRFF
jgi:hypothetical protein